MLDRGAPRVASAQPLFRPIVSEPDNHDTARDHIEPKFTALISLGLGTKEETMLAVGKGVSIDSGTFDIISVFRESARLELHGKLRYPLRLLNKALATF